MGAGLGRRLPLLPFGRGILLSEGLGVFIEALLLLMRCIGAEACCAGFAVGAGESAGAGESSRRFLRLSIGRRNVRAMP